MKPSDDKPEVDDVADLGEFKPSKELVAAIDASVESDRAEKAEKDERRSKSKSKEKPEKIPDAKAQAADDPSPVKDEGDGKTKKQDEPVIVPVAIPDSLIERAVKAGMSFSDAKEFKDEKSLERIVGVLEKKSATPTGAKDEKKAEATDDLAAQVASIPDDLDPEVYDENFIKLAKTFKAVVASLQAEVKTMRDSGVQRSEQSWYDSQVAGLGKEVADSLDAGKKSDLEKRFKVLEAGYKAVGQEMKREDVFKEAAKMVIGDVPAADLEAKKKDAAAKRAEQQISRPGPNKVTEKGDPMEAVASDLAKYREKKGLS